jgi:hypothetical protein
MTITPGTGLAGLQRQQVEVGRIRIGISEPTGRTDRNGREIRKGKKLDTFRFTSQSQMLIGQVAQLYGGTPQQWQPQNGGAPQWEVFIDRPSVPVVVPPRPISQFFEQWAGGRCAVRCTGERELISDTPCLCDPDPRARKCKPTTRLSVMLSEIPGIGLWRLESHGYYSAVELPAVAELLALAGGHIRATLELQQRQVVRAKTNGTGNETIAFAVPVLHAAVTPGELLSGHGAINPAALTGQQTQPAAVGSAERPAIEAAPETNPHLTDLLGQIAEADDRDEMQLLQDQIKTRLRGDERKTAAAAWSARAREIAARHQPDEPTQPDPSDKPTHTPPPQPDKPAQPGPAPNDKPSPAETARPEPDDQPARLAAFQTLLGQAAAAGWDTTTLTTRFEETMGVDRYDATADQFREFATRQGW